MPEVLAGIIQMRNNFATLASGEMRSGGARLDPVPRLDAIIHVLDQALDRIADKLRLDLMRCYLEGKLDEAQKKEVVAVLEAHANNGLWADPERDIDEAEERWQRAAS